jgi:hypothetical protein
VKPFTPRDWTFTPGLRYRAAVDRLPLPLLLTARLTRGQWILDAPTDLPDGTTITLLAIDPAGWLPAADRAALTAALVEQQDTVLIRARWRPADGRDPP